MDADTPAAAQVTAPPQDWAGHGQQDWRAVAVTPDAIEHEAAYELIDADGNVDRTLRLVGYRVHDPHTRGVQRRYRFEYQVAGEHWTPIVKAGITHQHIEAAYNDARLEVEGMRGDPARRNLWRNGLIALFSAARLSYALSPE